jgi:hypothetical protein
LERRIVRAALAAASSAESSRPIGRPPRRLEHEHVHWRLPKLDDVLELE